MSSLADPANQVGEQVAVIGQIVAREAPIEVGRQEGDACAASRGIQDQARESVFGSRIQAVSGG